MTNGRIRIDPMFVSKRTYAHEREGPRSNRVAVVVGAVAVFAFGWIFGATTPSDEIAGTAPSTSTPTPADTTSSTIVTAAETTPQAAIARLSAALGAAVPGFSDTLTLVTETDHGVDIAQWRPSASEPQTVLSTEHSDPSDHSEPNSRPPVGMDASGHWYARILDTGALEVGSLPGDLGEPTERHEIEPVGGVADMSIGTPTWHSDEPGRLVWLESRRDHNTSAVALYALHVSDGLAPEAGVLARGLPRGDWTGIESWISPGILLGNSPGPSERAEHVLVDTDGTEITRVPGAAYVTEGPDGATLWSPEAETIGAEDVSFLLSPDGRRHTPIPYLEDDERVCTAAWSPTGEYLAMSVKRSSIEPRFLIIAPDSGAIEFDAPLPVESCCAVAWSPDGTRVALAARSRGSGSQIFVVQPGNQDLGIGHREAHFGDPGCAQALLWSTSGRFLVAPVWHPLSGTSTLMILDTERGFEVSVPISGRLVDLRIADRG